MKEYRFEINNFGLGKAEPGDILEWMSEGLTKDRYDDLVCSMFFNNQYNNCQPGETGISTWGMLFVNSVPCFALRLNSRQDRLITSTIYYDLKMIRAGDAKMLDLRSGVVAE